MALTDNIKAFWKFDESSGSAADATGNGNTLSLTGAPSYVAGKINNAISLVKASTQYLSYASWSKPAGSFSVSAWIKLSSSPADNTIAQDNWTSSTNGFQFNVKSSNGKLFLRYWNSSGNDTSAEGSTVLSAGTWYHVVVTVASGSGGAGIIMYVNGVAETMNILTDHGGSIGTCTEPLYVGANFVAGQLWDGLIDALGIWSRVLSSSEVTTLYNSGNGIQYPFSNAYILSTVTETLSLSETLSKAWGATLSDVEQLNLSDTLISASAYAESIAEQISLSDLATVDRLILIEVSEQISLSDAESNVVGYLLVASDQFSLSDLATISQQYNLAIVDQISLSETVAIDLTLGILIQEVLGLSDLTELIKSGWSFKTKHAAVWSFGNKNSSTWTFKDKHSSSG